MFVTTPYRYLRLAQGPHRYVPLWLPESKVAVEVADVWLERRLTKKKFSRQTALYHVKLPDACIMTCPDSETYELPVTFDQDQNVNQWGVPIIAGPSYYNPGVITIYVEQEINGVHGVLEVKAVCFWQGATLMWSVSAAHYQAQPTSFNYAALRRASLGSWSPPDLILWGTPTAILSWVRAHLPASPTWVQAKQERVYEATGTWTEQTIRTRVDQIVKRNSRYDEEDLVRNCAGVRKVDDSLHFHRYVKYKTVTKREPYKVERESHWYYRGQRYTKRFTKTYFRKVKVRIPIVRVAKRWRWERVAPNPSSRFFETNIELLKVKQAAYLAALDDVPYAAKNNLQNLTQAWQVLSHFAFDRENTEAVFEQLARTQSPLNLGKGPKRLITKEVLDRQDIILPEIPRHASTAWLGGRYVLTTGVMDAGAAWNYFFDIVQKEMGTRSRGWTCHGEEHVDDATVCCTFHISPNEMQGKIAKIFETAYRLGIEPNAYVMWDLIPFSFVADWFFPIGSALDAYTKASHFCPLYYNYDSKYGEANYSFCYSVKYKVLTEIGELQYYCRWYERQSPNVDTSFILLDNPYRPSQRTECWRAVDALALIF